MPQQVKSRNQEKGELVTWLPERHLQVRISIALGPRFKSLVHWGRLLTAPGHTQRPEIPA